MPNFDIARLIANVPALLIGFAVHEYAHALVADRLGDPTPRSQGRLTMNPFVHLDIFGTLMALLYSFGWAKPVQTQPHYFKGSRSKGMMYVSLAGPMANLITAFIATFFWIIASHFLTGSSWGPIVSQVFMSLVFMNLGLGIFNLLPIPPLDGFKILGGILPSRFGKYLYTIEKYGLFILVIVLFTNILSRVLYPLINGLFILFYQGSYLVLSPILG